MKLLVIIFVFSQLFFINCVSYWKCESDSCKTGKVKLKNKYCDIYEGEVKNGKPFGFGKLIHAGDECEKKGYTRGKIPGTIYEGIWGSDKDGNSRLTGEGKIIFTNGLSYGGNIINDWEIIGGNGFIKLANGDVLSGIWDHNNLCVKGDCKNGYGVKYFISTGRIDKFEGVFTDSYLNGECKSENLYFWKTNPISYVKYSTAGKCIHSTFNQGNLYCEKKYSQFCKSQYDFYIFKNNLLKKMINSSPPLPNINLILE